MAFSVKTKIPANPADATNVCRYAKAQTLMRTPALQFSPSSGLTENIPLEGLFSLPDVIPDVDRCKNYHDEIGCKVTMFLTR